MSRRAHLQALADAWTDYQAKLAALGAIAQCDSYWPSDLPDTDYPGTRCDLTADHAPGDDNGGHRARIPGSRAVVTW